MSPEIAFTTTEAMICQTARLVEPKYTYWVGGGGEPILSILLAQKHRYPDLVYVTEDGVVGPNPMLPFEPIMTMVASRSCYRALAWDNMNGVQWHASVGAIDVGILNCLQVDQYGNFNSSLIGGTYERPARRFGGAGGANEIASLCWRTILITDQVKRKFVKKTDFATSPGFIDGTPGARERAGLPKGTGPYRVITDKAMFGYDESTHRMKLLAVARWSSVEEILANMDFEPMIAERLETIEPPTEDELLVMRTQVDPGGRTVGSGEWITVEVD